MTVTIPYEFNPEFCLYRLPCGICERTNNMCPLQKSGYEIDYRRPTTVTTDSTGVVKYELKNDNGTYSCGKSEQGKRK